MAPLDSIRLQVEALAEVIKAPRMYLPTYEVAMEGAWPCIRIRDSKYEYFRTERGTETVHLSTSVVDDLLFRIFADITSEMAGRYQVEHRRSGEDSRRPWFEHQIYLLGRVNGSWADRRRAEQAEILKEYPYFGS